MITLFTRPDPFSLIDFFPDEEEVTGFACSCGCRWALRSVTTIVRLPITCPACGYQERNPR